VLTLVAVSLAVLSAQRAENRSDESHSDER